MATGLSLPWDAADLGDGSALVTERSTARVLRVVPGRAPVQVGKVVEARPAGEGGLLGITLAPDFRTSHRVYLYVTTATGNSVLRGQFVNGRLTSPLQPVLTGIPKATRHDGGRVAFGPDGMLYVTTGDVHVSTYPQNVHSLAGKILRVTPDGKVPATNPFRGLPVWTYGHRNVQGIAWDSRGTMYASELGDAKFDELNRIIPGKNYGWPLVEGRGTSTKYVNPVVVWGPTSVASPSGIAIVKDVVLVAALHGASVYAVPLGPAKLTSQRFLHGTIGRVRFIRTVGTQIWAGTSNTTGDRIVRLSVACS